jgi:uncharacterized protein YecE (DUF72 family)
MEGLPIGRERRKLNTFVAAIRGAASPWIANCNGSARMTQALRRRPPFATGNHRDEPLARIGCSGWQYKHWRGDFYPDKLPQHRWLEYYSARFNTVEINNTFYRLPEAPAFSRWAGQAPPGFVYAVKASRFLTHMKKLKDPQEPLNRLLERADHLDAALGPVLFQLPPRWPLNIERLSVFLEALPPRHRYAIEFREPTWYADDVLALLERHHVALCLHDMPGSASQRIITGRFVYVRFHGVEKYSGSYSDRTLDEWADWLSGRLTAGIPVYAYFNNDIGGHAPRDAVRLRTRLVERVARVDDVRGG